MGNKNANGFWAANLPLEEEIHSGAPDEQRATFIRRKYRERKYRRLLEDLHGPEELNKVELSRGMSQIQTAFFLSHNTKSFSAAEYNVGLPC